MHYNFSFKLFFSTILLALATILAITQPSQITFNLVLILAGFLFSGLASFFKIYRSYLNVRFAALQGARFASQIFPQLEFQDVSGQIMLMPVTQFLGKGVGMGILFASKVLDWVILSLASFLGLFYLVFSHFGKTDPLPFIGAWIVILGLVFLFLDSIPFLSGITKSWTSLALGISSWFFDSFSIWIFLVSLGYSLNPLSVFLPLSILLILEKISPVFYGLGQNEVLGELELGFIGIPLFPAFLAFFFWDISRLFISMLLTLSWRGLERRRIMASLV